MTEQERSIEKLSADQKFEYHMLTLPQKTEYHELVVAGMSQEKALKKAQELSMPNLTDK